MMIDSDDLHDLAPERNDVVRIERLTHHIQRIREDQMDEIRATTHSEQKGGELWIRR